MAAPKNKHWVPAARREPTSDAYFDPFSGSAGVDRDFDDPRSDELVIVEKLRDRGHF